ncbi:hypothetical protein EXIGLDRAFT_279182 [Exidia glandulosa HHB12029]|uniref:DH domain-containing protein n=1 Tax=Exidia glandulosa HHB12029 TaxID=1314781 RepID=A0A165DK07_EXIGL|nr:hypothetical protein EXIGLDRAFT_279182 [Exidia glandulosa HHB12029]
MLDVVSPAASPSSGSSEHLHTPPEGKPVPRLRPPLPRMISSRRWTMPTSTRRAMLCTQEIVETEDNYRRALGQLLRGETTFPPPSRLTALVPALLASSPRFATSPRLPGLATAHAFIEAAPALEKALVEWCAVVGRFFLPRSRSGFTSDLSSLRSVSMRNLNVLRPRPRLGVGSTNDLVEIGVGGGKRAKKVPTVQDLAIQPTQRAVRYVLLFRELLRHVNVEEREDVQRALDAALRIARKCDEALELVVAHPQRTKQ